MNNKLSIDQQIVRLAHLIKRLRKFKNESDAEINTKTTLLFWYTHTKVKFQCHIMGKLVHGDSLEEVVLNAQDAFVCLYNFHFKTSVSDILKCSFDEDPKNWSKERLLEEYLKVKNQSNQPKEISKAMPSLLSEEFKSSKTIKSKTKSDIAWEDFLDPIRKCADDANATSKKPKTLKKHEQTQDTPF